MSENQNQIVPAEPPSEEPKRKPIVAGERGIQIQGMADMFRLAEAIHNSRMAPRGFENPQAVLVAMQFGMEVGLTPMQAVQSIAIINGRPCMWGDACLALCTSRADFEDIEETIEGDGERRAATCIVKRRNRTAVRRTFTMADAKRAGLLGKSGPWSQYPDRMLQMRARGFALRDAFPDALRGIGVREEVKDIPNQEEKPIHAVTLTFPDEAPQQPEANAPEAKEGELL